MVEIGATHKEREKERAVCSTVSQFFLRHSVSTVREMEESM